jgi:hypothetical protein
MGISGRVAPLGAVRVATIESFAGTHCIRQTLWTLGLITFI